MKNRFYEGEMADKEIDLSSPHFIVPLRSLAVPENADVQLTCTISGSPEPTVTWYKNGQILNNLSGILKDNCIHILHLYKCTEEDAGLYQVSARNNQGMASCSAVLEVGSLTRNNIFHRLKQKHSESLLCRKAETAKHHEKAATHKENGDIIKRAAADEMASVKIQSESDVAHPMADKKTAKEFSNLSKIRSRTEHFNPTARPQAVAQTTKSLIKNHMVNSNFDAHVLKSNSTTSVTTPYQKKENSDLAGAMTGFRSPVGVSEIADKYTGAQRKPLIHAYSKKGCNHSNEFSLGSHLISEDEDDEYALDDLKCSDVMTDYTNALWNARLQGHELPPLKESDGIDDDLCLNESQIGSLKENIMQPQVSNYSEDTDDTIGFPADDSRLWKPSVQKDPSGDSCPARRSVMVHTATKCPDSLPSVAAELESMAIKDPAIDTWEENKEEHNGLAGEESIQPSTKVMTEGLSVNTENLKPNLKIKKGETEAWCSSKGGKGASAGSFSEGYCPGITYTDKEMRLSQTGTVDSKKPCEWDMTKVMCSCEHLRSVGNTTLSDNALVTSASTGCILLQQTNKGEAGNTIRHSETSITDPCLDYELKEGEEENNGPGKSDKDISQHFPVDLIHRKKRNMDNSSQRTVSSMEVQLPREASDGDIIVSAVKTEKLHVPEEYLNHEEGAPRKGKDFMSTSDSQKQNGSLFLKSEVDDSTEKHSTPLYQEMSPYGRGCLDRDQNLSKGLVNGFQMCSNSCPVLFKANENLETSNQTIGLRTKLVPEGFFNEGEIGSVGIQIHKKSERSTEETETHALFEHVSEEDKCSSAADAESKSDTILEQNQNLCYKDNTFFDQCQFLGLASAQATFQKSLCDDSSCQKEIASGKPVLTMEFHDLDNKQNKSIHAFSNVSKEISDVIRLTSDILTTAKEDSLVHMTLFVPDCHQKDQKVEKQKNCIIIQDVTMVSDSMVLTHETEGSHSAVKMTSTEKIITTGNESSTSSKPQDAILVDQVHNRVQYIYTDEVNSGKATAENGVQQSTETWSSHSAEKETTEISQTLTKNTDPSKISLEPLKTMCKPLNIDVQNYIGAQSYSRKEQEQRFHLPQKTTPKSKDNPTDISFENGSNILKPINLDRTLQTASHQVNTDPQSFAMCTSIEQCPLSEASFETAAGRPLNGAKKSGFEREFLEKEKFCDPEAVLRFHEEIPICGKTAICKQNNKLSVPVQPEKETSLSTQKKEKNTHRSHSRKKKNWALPVNIDNIEHSHQYYKKPGLPSVEAEKPKVIPSKGKPEALEAKPMSQGKKNNENLMTAAHRKEHFHLHNAQNQLSVRNIVSQTLGAGEKVTILENSVNLISEEEIQTASLVQNEDNEELAKRIRLSDEGVDKDTSEVECQKPELGKNDYSGQLKKNERKASTEMTHKKPHKEPHTEKQQEEKTPNILQNIQAERNLEDSGNISLCCQFGNIHTDCSITWIKDGSVLAEVERSTGDESPVFFTIVKASNKDVGIYQCQLKSSLGNVSLDYCFSLEALNELIPCQNHKVAEGENIKCTELMFRDDFLSDQYFGDNQYGSITTEEDHFGEGMHRKAFRTTIVDGLKSLFHPGHPCVLKVHNSISYGTKTNEELVQKNYDLAVEECHVQNTARQYLKAYTEIAMSTEGFGDIPEIIPIYLVHRPTNEIPYATLEEELIGDFVKYSVKDGKEINLMRRDSDAGQKCCTFQHWVYQNTEGNLLITDMQGVGMKLTDVGIATCKKGFKGFKGNCATSFIDQFKVLHQCNRFCEMLGLKPLQLSQQKSRRTAPAPKPLAQPTKKIIFTLKPQSKS
uniref:non-specific serine/threonine protein kinase n=1 Tax=Lepisosteus oculatus TaxID=7918 RepID=W5N1T4_LEPOC|nr:PREDICTED: alpha-protein kinase 2 isoform X2 [Lepisosteus oculatus]